VHLDEALDEYAIHREVVILMPLRGNRRENNRVNCTVDKYIERTVGNIFP
jgi:hypothetical protein